MPYFVDKLAMKVVVMPPGATLGVGQMNVKTAIAEACGLTHGQSLTNQQIQALRAESVEAFQALAEATETAPTSEGLRIPGVATARQESDIEVVSAARRGSVANRARTVARVVEVASWLFLTLSVISGIAVATTTTTEYGTKHPRLGLGFSIALVGSFQALVVIMIATYIQARTE